ncbi:MAG: TRAP transporter substrate-binding protein [Bdellovibrionales bacterium]|nr:TRAP transporter substrate-binding protein [Bdellovibrionales bacterium]
MENRVGRQLSFLWIALFFVIAGSGFGWAAESQPEKIEIKWVLAHEPSSVFRHAAVHFQKILADETKGQMSVKIMTLKEYGGEGATIEGLIKDIQAGKIQMTQTYTFQMGQLEKSFYVLDLPFLFRDHEHAARVLEGPTGNRLMESLVAHNMRGLAFTYSGGYRVVPTATKKISRYEDFKGLKVRTALSPVTEEVYRRLGAVSVPGSIDAGAELTGKGKLDGLETTYVRYSSDLESKAPVMNETFHTLFLTGILVNNSFYEKLPPKYKESLKKAAIQAGRDERATTLSDTAEIRSQIQKRGVKIVEMSQKERQRFRSAMQPVYDKFDSEFSKGLIKEIVGL